MMRVFRLLLLLLAVASTSSWATGEQGVPPDRKGQCPADHPIKGNFTTYSGEPCIYHVPGGRFYDKANAERCYASESSAQADGCRKSKR